MCQNAFLITMTAGVSLIMSFLAERMWKGKSRQGPTEDRLAYLALARLALSSRLHA
jgi:hypothetical protein